MAKENQNDNLKTKNIPPPPLSAEGLLAAQNNNEVNDTLKKWRHIILNAIYPRKEKNKIESEEPASKSRQIEPKKILAQQKITKPQKNKSRSRKIVLIILSILIFLVSILSLLTLAVYYLNWNNRIIAKAINLIPYPAGAIKTPCGWKILTIKNYSFDLQAINHFYAQKKLTDEKFIPPPINDTKKNIIEKELRNQFVLCFASQHNIKTSQEEIDQTLNQTIEQAGDQETLKEIVKNLYNWDIETFKQKVLYYYLLENKLAEVIPADQIDNEFKKCKIYKFKI